MSKSMPLPKDRIIAVKDYLRTSLVLLADELDVNKQTLYNIRSGSNIISRNLAEKIHINHPEIRLEWLLTGKGSMLRDDENKIPDGERIVAVKDYLQTTFSDMALELGIHRQTLYNIKGGTAILTNNLAKLINNVYPAISYEWLLTGEGDMLTKEEKEIINNNGAIMQGVVGDNNTQNVGTSDTTQQLIEALKKINEQQQLIHELQIKLINQEKAVPNAD